MSDFHGWKFYVGKVMVTLSLLTLASGSFAETLVIVHPTNFFAQGEASEGLKEVAEEFLSRESKGSVYSLIETNDILRALRTKSEAAHNYKDIKEASTAKAYREYFPLVTKTQLIASLNGDNNIVLESPRVTVAGGYLLACLKVAIRDLYRTNQSHFPKMEISFPMKAIYGKDMFLKGASLKKVLVKYFAARETTIAMLVNVDGELVLKTGEGEPRLALNFASDVSPRKPAGLAASPGIKF